MLPQVVTVGPLVAANAALLVVSATPVSGTALTLTGTALDTARRILLTYGNEAAPRTLVVTGTNQTGNAIKETLAVPSGGAGTVSTVQDFLTVTSLLPLGGGWTAAVTVGTSGIASSPWKAVNFEFGPMNMSIRAIVSGTINYTLEYTADNFNANQSVNPGVAGNYPVPVNVFPDPTLAAATASGGTQVDGPIYGWRVTVNSQTNPAFVTVTAIQAGIAGNA